MSFLITHTRAQSSFFFFFNDTATTEIYTLSLHDALPIFRECLEEARTHHHLSAESLRLLVENSQGTPKVTRSEEHTSELQSPCNLVCRLLLEKKKKMDRKARYRIDHVGSPSKTDRSRRRT